MVWQRTTRGRDVEPDRFNRAGATSGQVETVTVMCGKSATPTLTLLAATKQWRG